MTSLIVSKKTAHANPAHHQFMPGLGYIAHGAAPEIPKQYHRPAINCAPPAEAKDGTTHWLKPPNGHPEIAMVWNGRNKVWMSPKPDRSNRLAWTPDFLKSAGWTYVGVKVEK